MLHALNLVLSTNINYLTELIILRIKHAQQGPHWSFNMQVSVPQPHHIQYTVFDFH